jgi:hypothetical protein
MPLPVKKKPTPKLHIHLSGKFAKVKEDNRDQCDLESEYDPDAETTSRYDMGTYSHVIEYLQSKRLKCFWRVVPLHKGAMLYLEKGGEQVRLFVESPEAIFNWADSLLDWT